MGFLKITFVTSTPKIYSVIHNSAGVVFAVGLCLSDFSLVQSYHSCSSRTAQGCVFLGDFAATIAEIIGQT
jgi:hypothetical protein